MSTFSICVRSSENEKQNEKKITIETKEIIDTQKTSYKYYLLDIHFFQLEIKENKHISKQQEFPALNEILWRIKPTKKIWWILCSALLIQSRIIRVQLIMC